MSTNNIRLRTHYIYLITNNLNGYNYVGEKNIMGESCPEGFREGKIHKKH